jgi:hypothetical protein
MKAIFRLIVLVLLVGGWAAAAGALHVVITPDRIVIVPKQRFDIVDSVVDTRHWIPDEVPYHPRLVERLLSSGKAMALAHVYGAQNEAEAAQRLTQALQVTPASRPTSQPFYWPF